MRKRMGEKTMGITNNNIYFNTFSNNNNIWNCPKQKGKTLK